MSRRRRGEADGEGSLVCRLVTRGEKLGQRLVRRDAGRGRQACVGVEGQLAMWQTETGTRTDEGQDSISQMTCEVRSDPEAFLVLLSVALDPALPARLLDPAPFRAFQRTPDLARPALSRSPLCIISQSEMS